METMAIRVTGLYTYPIKSCARLSHERIALDERGPVYDRYWMVVDPSGKFQTQRELPRLALVQPAFADEALTVSAPGMDDLCVPLAMPDAPPQSVVVWRDTVQAIDEGDEAARWLSDFIGAPLRLVRMAEGYRREVDPTYAKSPAIVGFADGYPLLLASDESLNDLNVRLEKRGKTPLPMSRFRPNVVIQGAGAWAEDDWTRIRIGGLPLDVVKPCARCVTTTVDQATGTIPDHEEPLATLATFRKAPRGVMFGQNVIHLEQGALCVGDSVEIIGAAL
jgi:uncharacterized protein YcbX